MIFTIDRSDCSGAAIDAGRSLLCTFLFRRVSTRLSHFAMHLNDAEGEAKEIRELSSFTVQL